MHLARIISSINQKVPARVGTLSLLLVLLFLTVYLHFDNVEQYAFAEEIGNVAASVVQGDGFANVFDKASGPTAWCPPLYVSYYALIFAIFGVKSIYAAWAIYILRCLFLVLSYQFLSKVDYGTNINRFKILLLPIFLLYTVIVVITKKPDDVFLHIFMSSALIYYLSRYIQNGFDNQFVGMLILALLVPFTNISFFTGMIAIIIGVLMFKPYTSNNDGVVRKYSLLLILVLFAGSIGWGLRNSSVLNQFIPFKSNLWFEFYLANVKDTDGISKWSNFRKYHPLGNEQVRENYTTMGETAFLRTYKEQSFNYLKNNPQEFIVKVKNRISDVYLITSSQKDIEKAAVDMIDPHDIKKLNERQLIVDNYWVCLEATASEIFNVFRDLELNNLKVVEEDWLIKSSNAKRRINREDSPKELIKSLIISTVPLLMLLAGLIIRPIRTNKMFILVLVLYLLSIGPYITVSFLPRYQYFQLTFFVVFMFLVSSTLINQFANQNYLSDNTPGS